jgi:hypothetical protein
MLESIKRLFGKHSAQRDLAEVSEWARQHGFAFKRVRGEDGFVIDGTFDGMPWRLEWGPPQRDYIGGHELRLRMELSLPHDMQMLLLSRPLLDALERAAYEQFTDSTQTQIGSQAPEEMRWLVMFQKVDTKALKALHAAFGAVASVPASALSWIEGPLAEELTRSVSTLLRDAPPFVLMTLRSRAYLRMRLDDPDPVELSAALAIFETGVVRALRAAASFNGPRGEWRPTSSTAWQSLESDNELHDRGKPL